MVTQGRVSPEELEQFYNTTEQASLVPGWLGRARQLRPSPVPYLWRWSDVEPLVHRSGEVVTPDRDVERRVLRLANPALEHGTTHTISAALQLLLPGECAPAHRHTPTAIRWVLQGEGAYTTVEGDKCYMERGDLILTPSWTWHDHNHEGAGPMIWLDGLDTPLVRNLDAVSYERYPEDRFAINAAGKLKLTVKDTELLARDDLVFDRQAYAAMQLKAGWHRIVIEYEPTGNGDLSIMFGGETVTTYLEGKSIRH